LSQNAAHFRHIVTAVVVAHDGARLLPGLVHAVREQTHPVQRIVGVDTGSQDRSGATLTELLGQDAVFGMEPDTGYGAAVARALQHSAARRPAPGPQGTPAPGIQGSEWIWLLHDDCEPAADALEQLLSAASRSQSVAVLGPKLKDLSDRRVVREAGITTDRAGRRLTGVEPGEIDQGQHDGSRAVLAVSSAGMLIRRDVWDQLGGFDANLPLFRDDIDFCWRAHAAGYEVRVISDAVVYHRELSARQMRKSPATGGHSRLLDRRSALYVFAVNLPFWPMLAAVAGGLAGSVVRAAYFLITKQQGKAAAHLGAVAWVLRHPLLIRRERRRRAADRKHGYAVLRGQLPRGRTLSRLAESAAGLLSRESGYESSGLHHAVVDEPSDDLPLPATDSVIRRVLTSPGVLLFAGLAVVALVAERSLTGSVLSGSATLEGGTLAPAWGGAGNLWHEYLAGYHDTGIGSAASAPPYVGVMAVLATLLGGKPWLATDVLLLGCVPAAGVTAFLATRHLTSVLAARIWIAASYALLPVATGAVAAGRIGTGAAFVLLPLIGMMLGRMLTGPPPTSSVHGGLPPPVPPGPSRFTARRAAWAAGLLTAIAAAFVPLAWPVAVIAAVAAAAAWPWLGGRTVINAAIVAVVPAVILIPWTFYLVTNPSAFFGEAGLVRPGLAANGLRPESLLLLSPGGPGLPPAWVTAGLVLPAFCALLARRRIALVYAGWGIALGGLVMALVVSRVRVTPPQGGTAVSAWPGIAIAIAAAGLLLAATPLIEAATRALGGDRVAGRRRVADWRFLAMVAGLAVAVSAPALAAGYWLADGLDGPVAAAGPQILPAFVAASSAGPDRTRTLVLRQDGGGLSYAVLRDADPVLGEPELAQTASSTHALDGVVASLAAAGGGDAGDTGHALSQFDIGYLLLPAPIDQALARQLNAAAGLEPLTRASSYDLWQVSGTVARVSVLTPGGTTVPVRSGSVGVNAVVAPDTSGTLLLAEPAGGWSATLNGKPLTKLAAPVDGWAQGFVLPAGGGRLVISRNETARDVSLGVEAAALLVAFALAVPGTRSSVAADSAAIPVGRRREHAGGVRSARRKRRPQVALVGVTASGVTRADDGSGSGADTAYGADSGYDPDTYPGTGYSGAGSGYDPDTYSGAGTGYDPDTYSGADSGYGPGIHSGADTRHGADTRYGADAGYDADPEYGATAGAGLGAAPGFPPRPERRPAVGAARISAYGPEPALDAAPHMDEDPAPWAGLPRGGRASAGDASAGDASAGDASAGPPGPAAPRRGRGGQHAPRHGKPPRRRRGGPADRSDAQTPAGPPPPSPAGRDAGQASRTASFEVPDFPGPDDDGGTGPLAWRDEAGGYDPRAPWERGDSS
jgi:GT2 family glycosyltransferase